MTNKMAIRFKDNDFQNHFGIIGEILIIRDIWREMPRNEIKSFVLQKALSIAMVIKDAPMGECIKPSFEVRLESLRNYLDKIDIYLNDEVDNLQNDTIGRGEVLYINYDFYEKKSSCYTY